MNEAQQRRLAEAGILASGALWGIFWLPVRTIEAAGLPGGWSTLAVYLAALVLVVPLIWRAWPGMVAAGVPFLVTGLLTGAGFAWYMSALLLTEVVRTILLFYLTPVWSTLLARAVYGRPITRRRACALGSGMAGLILVLGAGGTLPVPSNAGDWLALGAGLAWAFGSLRLEHDQAGGAGTIPQFVAFVAGGAVVTAATLLVMPAGAVGAFPDTGGLVAALPWVLVTVVAIVLPACYLAIYGAERLPAGRVGILLMTEVIVGVASAAVLLPAEPFTAAEAGGTVLIVAATLFELAERHTA